MNNRKSNKDKPALLLLRPAYWLFSCFVFILLTAAAIWYETMDISFLYTAFAGMFISVLGLGWAMGRSQGQGQDITWLAKAVENGADGFLLTDRDGGFAYCNDRFHMLLSSAGTGPARRVEQLQDIADAADEAARQEGGIVMVAGTSVNIGSFNRLIMASQNSQTASEDIAFKNRAGRIDWRRISIEPVFNNNKRYHTLWRVEDVTSTKEIEQIWHLEKQRSIEMLDSLPAGIFSTNSQGNLLYINDTLAEWFGLTPDEAINRPFADFIVAVGEEGQFTLRSMNGETFPATLVRSQRETTGDEAGNIRALVVRNFALPEQTEAPNPPSAPVPALTAESLGIDAGMRWLFQEAPVAIVLLDLDGNIVECNRSFGKMLGKHREVLVSSPFTKWILREDQGEATTALSKVVMGTMRAAHLEIRMPGAGQRELVTSLYASRLEDIKNEVSGVVLHFIDTTEQKNLEIQFAQSQKMQAIGQLAGGVAHDFNNLLTAMIGFSDLLLTRHGPGDPDFADIQQIRQNANRATNLVRQLLAFSRQQSLVPARIDVTDSLSDLAELLRRLIGEKIELVMEPGRNLKAVYVDRGQFDQVIINLCVNARDAMPGGGSITIRTESVSVDEPVQRGHDLMPEGEYVLIEISDTGTGIAKEDMVRIFDPFFTTKEVGQGTGLGLSTVYGIIHQTGGFIFVDSAPGEGTTFSIYVPEYTSDEVQPIKEVTAGSEAVSSIGTPDETDLTGRGRILLVEDEDAVRSFGSRALRNKGYTILEAENAEAGLDVINSTKEKIDLIISDVVMPGMDGHTFVSLVRQELPDIKVILMSGYAEDVHLEAIDRDTGIEFLGKPFSLKELASKVKNVMES